MYLKLKIGVRRINMTGEVIKRYTNKGRVVTIVNSNYGYTFCIVDKCVQKKYVSTPYKDFEECEKDSYKMVKNIRLGKNTDAISIFEVVKYT